ncbi:MAG TPA: TFIIB-type zinc ribbon-containing protein [Acidilobales archaeon]|nr:TFIIB-type zinc ribbon-containing protein [Acidilobales archaeon]
MKCPNCGSRALIWDYSRGDVVCTSCGYVVERIYVTSYNSLTNECQEELRHSRYLKPLIKPITVKYLKFMKSLSKLNGVKLDTDAVLRYLKGEAPRVKIIKRELNEGLLRDSLIKKVFNVMRKYPRLNSRTDRAKLAIALIALNIVKESNRRLNDVMEVLQRDTKLSRVHIKRLISLILKERNFIEDVRRVVQSIPKN